MTALRQIDFGTAREIAERKGVRPTKVRGTNTLRFSTRKDDRLEVITWDEFERVAVSRRLAVYEGGGWMKLMRVPSGNPASMRKP
ncbi:MAG TPA: hypothetical protein VII27_07650 [Thermoplasmata archaeon]